MQLRLELVTVPVSDVDRAKAFYVDQVGFSSERDVVVDAEHRFVELVPPGSPCSIALTTGYVDAEPGSMKGIQANVDDVNQVHAFLRDHDVDVIDIQQYPWGRFCFFSDPDGNGCRCTSRRTRADTALQTTGKRNGEPSNASARRGSPFWSRSACPSAGGALSGSRADERGCPQHRNPDDCSCAEGTGNACRRRYASAGCRCGRRAHAPYAHHGRP